MAEQVQLLPAPATALAAEVGHRDATRVRRISIRVGCNLLAIVVGLAAYSALSSPVSWPQIGWALGYLVLAILIDASHVRHEWTYVEECVLALKVGFGALLTTAMAGFLLGAMVSRILFLSVTVVMVALRPLAAWLADHLWPDEDTRRRLLLVCSEDEYAAVLDANVELGTQRYVIAGRLDDPRPVPGRRSTDSVRRPTDSVPTYRRSARGLLEACQRLRPSRLVLGASQPSDSAFVEAVASVNEQGVRVRAFPHFFEEEYGRVPLASIETSWFIFDIGPLHRIRYRIGRRVVDVVAGLVAGAVLVLCFPFLALMVKGSSRGPVLFHQRRSGQGGRPFTLVKLRTMPVDAESRGPRFAEDRDPRIDAIGRFLRRSRLDELPQSINLLRGEMSLIGPRPERPEFVQKFEEAIPFYTKRLLIKPGLTGWAQVHEGYGSSIVETTRKLERDLYYLKNQSFSLDLRILTATISSILQLAGR